MSALDSTTVTSSIHETILDAIGDTPLVRLGHLGSGVRPQLLAKVEYLNPGGSIKDRAAMSSSRRRAKASAPGRHDRRADVGQHGHRASPSRPAQGLPHDRR
jgi:hypothetical protein